MRYLLVSTSISWWLTVFICQRFYKLVSGFIYIIILMNIKFFRNKIINIFPSYKLDKQNYARKAIKDKAHKHISDEFLCQTLSHN
jgi:hypothetical protein